MPAPARRASVRTATVSATQDMDCYSFRTISQQFQASDRLAKARANPENVFSALQCVAVRCSALQCVALRCVLCVAVRCSVLQCVAVRVAVRRRCYAGVAVRYSLFGCVCRYLIVLPGLEQDANDEERASYRRSFTGGKGGGRGGENRKNYSNDKSNQHREIFQSAFPKSQVRVYMIEQ